MDRNTLLIIGLAALGLAGVLWLVHEIFDYSVEKKRLEAAVMPQEPKAVKTEAPAPAEKPKETPKQPGGKVALAFSWHHPDHGGGIWKERRVPQPGQMTYYLPDPVYLWYEKKTVYEDKSEHYDFIPFVPKVYTRPVQMYVGKELQTINVGMSPQECYDDMDWQCARDFENAETSLYDKVRMGVMVAMAAICFFALLIFTAIAMGGPKT